MPSLKTGFGLLKHTHKNQNRLDTAASAKNGFSALAEVGEEPDASTDDSMDKYKVQPIVSDVTVKLANTTVTDPATSSENEGRLESSKLTRRYGHSRNTIGKTVIPDGDWNRHKAAKRTTHLGRCVRHGPHNSTVFTANTRLIREPRTRSGVAFAEQNPGSCVWHYDYRPVLNRNTGENDPQFKYLITASDGSIWNKKGRYWITIARTRYTVTEVPVYSYEDTRLEKKSETKSEYLSLQALKIINDKPFINQSPENPVLEFEIMRKPDKVMRATMVVQYTEAITRDVDVDELRYVGNISYDHNEVLQELVKAHIGKAPDDH